MPTFYYGGEPYTRVGVVSNGYLVIGGGTGADVDFAPQTFPNPARPNNVIAPFWTDLNPAGRRARSASATLTDGVGARWLVVDWDRGQELQQRDHAHAARSGSSSPPAAPAPGRRASRSRSRTAPPARPAGDPGSGINWGAENRDGTSGKNIPAPARRTARSTIVTCAADGRRHPDDRRTTRRAKKAGTYKSVAGDDLGRHAGDDPGRADADRYAVGRVCNGAMRGAAGARPLVHSCYSCAS